VNPFAVARPESFEQASAVMKDGRFALPVLKAGGMDVVDHLKEGLMTPDVLVDVRSIGYRPGRGVRAGDGGGMRIEAMTTLAEIASSAVVRSDAPVLAYAAGSAATPQVRNVATAAGNLLQRPRCWYYRNDQFDCLKKGGHTCFAVEGENRFHAVFGGGPCHIVHPSNLAPALIVCGGTVHLTGGDRDAIAVADLYHLPERGLRSEHDLEPDAVITHLSLEPAPHSGFDAVKEKQSFDWPLVMSAVALEMTGSRIERARVCVGAVAPVPWPLPDVEAALRGVDVDDEDALHRACGLAARGARPLSDNAYKLDLLPVSIRRAVLRAAGRNVEAAR
jgi:xanthine dehydrogenase YagS FAD-binding subunit